MIDSAVIIVSGDVATPTAEGGTSASCSRSAMVSHARASGDVVSRAIFTARSMDFPSSGRPCNPINASPVVSGNATRSTCSAA